MFVHVPYLSPPTPSALPSAALSPISVGAFGTPKKKGARAARRQVWRELVAGQAVFRILSGKASRYLNEIAMHEVPHPMIAALEGALTWQAEWR